MLKRILYTAAAFISLLLLTGCLRDPLETDMTDSRPDLPEGSPVTLILPFSSIDQYEVDIRTKAESSTVDESRIQNLYVMLFDNTDTADEPKKIYGRYFSHDHLEDDAAAFNSNDNECWFVNNKTLNSGDGVLTEGAVKISTVTCSNATLVVIANITNTVTNLDGMNSLDRLKAVQNYNELKDIQVCLEQDIVNRKDLFLMTGELANKNTRDMMWNNPAGSTTFNDNYRVQLKHVDAKVKFRVKVNPTYISAAKPVYWQVCNTPDRCYLYTRDGQGNAPEEIDHFDSQQYYFEGTEYDRDPGTNEIINTYYTFCFYMLENNQSPNGTAERYYQREVRDKIDSGESGYEGKTGSQSGAFGTHFVENGEWKYAPTYGTYVRFDLILTLTSAGIAEMGNVDSGQLDITQALTSDAIFTVHLGNFVNSGDRSEKDGTPIAGSQFNDYETKRGHYYTYTITINNTTNILAEVTNDEEVQAGQEGFLLLTDTEIINADCHYEYHQISFDYRPHLDQEKFSWYVKTPFGEGGPVITKNLATGEYTYDGTGLDYLWVKFGVNHKVAEDAVSDGTDAVAWYDHSSGVTVCPYSKKRHAYPGESHYHPEWKPGLIVNDGDGKGDKSVPDLMDINQLIEYIFDQTKKEDAYPGSSDFIYDSGTAETPVIRMTAFIDEYYYEKDPTKPNAQADPDLWRKFVNANPRELHILSDAKSSRDRESDVIMSSHSVIQQSIQTIYNIYSADLQSLWGTEHIDEMRMITDGWPYWPSGKNEGRAGSFKTITGKENGRLNSAYIWNVYSTQDDNGNDKSANWNTFLNYDVHNNTPELNDEHHGMAYSCLTRNRDNNGDGKIDRNEVRWYLAAANQLIGMWVGNESLSMSARLYRPAEGQWRAHILSSSDRRVCWAEEGGGATEYKTEVDGETWTSFFEAAKGESVRCLRNIGTYSDGGAIKDITEAPYKVRPQNYFTISPTPDDNLTLVDDPSYHYVFSFDRLNPKSLRELTESDLPFNDQYSINNCVYLKMETQSRNDEQQLMTGEGDVYPDYNYPYDLYLHKVNEEVNKAGFNPFCPPGYRFPNQVEMLLMSVYLPESFFLRDSEGTLYKDVAGVGENTYMPTRTYFDRGLYGKNTEGFEFDQQGFNAAKNREQRKVGWSYSIARKKNTTARYNDNRIKLSRCVRDVNMTGTIEGGLLMNDKLYPGDHVPVSFSFYSSGSAFISASLKFCYTDGNGVYHERDIPVQTAPSGLQYLATQNIKLPTVTEMGLGDQPLSSAKPKFKITLRNAYVSKTFEQPVTLHNPLDGTITIIGEELYPSDNSLISFDISSQANSCKLQSRKLSLAYTDKDGAKRTIELLSTDSPIAPIPSDSFTYQATNQPIPLPGLSALNLSLVNVDDRRDAKLIMEVEDSGGSKKVVYKDIKLANPLTADAITLSDATNDSVYPGDQNHVSLGAQSKANTININSVTMELIPEGGSSTPISLPGGAPSSKVYNLTDGAISIPNLATLGVSASELDAGKSATLRATYTAGDYSKSFEKTVTIGNPITGTLGVATGYFLPDDDNTISFTLETKANSSNLASASFSLRYIDIDGVTQREETSFDALTLSGKQYSSDNTVTFPAISWDLSKPVTLVAHITDTAGTVKDVMTYDVDMISHISEAIFKIEKGATIPINVKLGIIGSKHSLSAKLLWSQDNSVNWQTKNLDGSLAQQTVLTTTDLTGFTPFTTNVSSATNQSVRYKLTVECTDGTSVTTPIGSITVLYYGFEPNNNIFAYYVDNLHFPNGDFIEASIDITGKTSDEYNKDEMIGFGIGTDQESTFNTYISNNAKPDITLHAFYRTDLGGGKNLRFGGWRNNTSNYKYVDVTFTIPDLNIRLDKEGLYYNETKAILNDLTHNYNNIIAADHLLVGAAQGDQRTIRSNAHYNYINVARQPYQAP